MTELTRRHALRLGVIGVALIGTSAGVAQLAAARPAPSGDVEFAEVYRGRRIRGAGPLPGRSTPRVFVDDVEVHLMPMHTGYTTQLNHYQGFRSPRLAARAAVHSLAGARPLPFHR